MGSADQSLGDTGGGKHLAAKGESGAHADPRAASSRADLVGVAHRRVAVRMHRIDRAPEEGQGFFRDSPLVLVIERLYFRVWRQGVGHIAGTVHIGLTAQEPNIADAKIAYDQISPPPPDRPANSIEFRQLATQLQEQRRILQKKLVDRENLEDVLKQARAVMSQCELEKRHPRGASADQLIQVKQRQAKARRGIPKLEVRLAALACQINDAKAERDRLQNRLDSVVRDDSRLRLLIQAGCQRPDLRPKAIMDCLKITARNVFIRLLELYRRHYNNRRDDHVILRQLTRSSGVLRLESGRLVIGLWHYAELPPATRADIRNFLADLSDITNRTFPDRPTPVAIALLETAPTL